jgi:hypothetical protein
MANTPYVGSKCRDNGHAWDDYDADESSPHEVIQIQKCIRCDAKRNRTISIRKKSLGELTKKPSINYPPGFLRPKGSGRQTAKEKALMRYENFQDSRQQRA